MTGRLLLRWIVRSRRFDVVGLVVFAAVGVLALAAGIWREVEY